MKLIHLGYPIGKLEADTPKEQYHGLFIVVPASEGDGSFIPSQSVYIPGKWALIALRDALLEAYPLQNTVDE